MDLGKVGRRVETRSGSGRISITSTSVREVSSSGVRLGRRVLKSAMMAFLRACGGCWLL